MSELDTFANGKNNEYDDLAGDLQDLVVGDVNKELFQEYINGKKNGKALHDYKDISDFLISKNMQYMMLDELVGEMGRLLEDCSNDTYTELEEQVIPDYLKLMRLSDTGNDENPMLLHELYLDITTFSNMITNHQEQDLLQNGIMIQSTIKYLQELDALIMLSQCHMYIHQLVTFLQNAKIGTLLVSDENSTSLRLFYHYYQLIKHVSLLLGKLSKCDSKFLHQLRSSFENNVLVDFNNQLEKLVLQINASYENEKGSNTQLSSLVYTILKDQLDHDNEQ
ncbi:hypothetical protein ACO0RG_000154 [Hanseniaspora osmophila]|uniref:Uncharacterized protein n=1 Tax=Hanseniaspora osmophila TaxID=56408 RepID=A0A1E5R651_9ASCO|nr:hypothetical protein AWRI3579_g3643 [Hanseniaspora osmophila]